MGATATVGTAGSAPPQAATPESTTPCASSSWGKPTMPPEMAEHRRRRSRRQILRASSILVSSLRETRYLFDLRAVVSWFEPRCLLV
ncbi:uncharacterized protein M6B38_176730 [Iris pallida]|uniref:Uncharacterized protein n=1 Tax=Iris pallida TaxID=29817 RepID=A0AAX6EQT4_IRIPA|nr:uncharacterized protein M6B38_176730 [Iris pallida]